MGWRVIWTTPAWNDVEEAARFIARDSPRYAVVLQREAQSAARSLRQFAYRGRVVPERDNDRLRELIVGSHRLIYKVVADNENPCYRVREWRSRSRHVSQTPGARVAS